MYTSVGPGETARTHCSLPVNPGHSDIDREYFFSTTVTPWLVRSDTGQHLWDQSLLVKTDDVWVFALFSAGEFKMVGVDQEGQIVDVRTAVYP